MPLFCTPFAKHFTYFFLFIFFPPFPSFLPEMPLNSLYEKLLFSLRSFSREKRADRKRKKRELCFGACGEWAGERKLLIFINQPGAEEMLGIGRRRGRFGFVRPAAMAALSPPPPLPLLLFPKCGNAKGEKREEGGGGEETAKEWGAIVGWMDGWILWDRGIIQFLDPYLLQY